MDEASGTLSAREELAKKLGDLQVRLPRQQKDVIDKANERRANSGKDRLNLTTVNNWFPKSNGKAPSIPNDFEDLWAVVHEMLARTAPTPASFEQRLAATKLAWRQLHDRAKRPIGLDESARGFLRAALKFAQVHPYPHLPVSVYSPTVSQVYVRQTSTRAADKQDEVHCRPSPEPAKNLFLARDRLCVLIAGPGGGKSTLLRTRLSESATAWLENPHTMNNKDPAVPVWIEARALADPDISVPTALAKATQVLSDYGLHQGLDTDHFLRRPYGRASWQLLVDGLDELPDAETRQKVLTKLHNALEEQQMYRCVVATRPLGENELTVLGEVPRYELDPYTTEDLLTYVEKHFSTPSLSKETWSQEEATRRAREFTAALRDASLTALARTPLMASLLCQLYLAEPERPLPRGRSGVYEDFTDRLYEVNPSKPVRTNHQMAIQRLVKNLHNPSTREPAEEAAQQALGRLPELVDLLAYQCFSGEKISVSAALESEPVPRPNKVLKESWKAFLSDILQHSGLLVHGADGLEFPHQTFLEYHAARHATRDAETRAELLDKLFPSDEENIWPPTVEASYLGFLLDGLIVLGDDVTAKTIEKLHVLTRQSEYRGERACRFLITQVRLRTNFGPGHIVDWLTRFTRDTSLDGFYRLRAAEVLAEVDQKAGTALLVGLADDDLLSVSDRVQAAECLSRWNKKAGTTRLTGFADDDLLSVSDRVQAAECLSRWNQKAGTTRLTGFADDDLLSVSGRVQAAECLSRWNQKAGTNRLTRFTRDTSLDGYYRVQAAKYLFRVDQKAGTTRLIHLADNRDLDGFYRVLAAKTLARDDEEAGDIGVSLLADLAANRDLDGFYRVRAAKILAGGSAQAGVDEKNGHALLARLAADLDVGGSCRVKAACALAAVDGPTGTTLLINFAINPKVAGYSRVQAAEGLAAEVDSEAGTALLSDLANDLGNDLGLDGYSRIQAAQALNDHEEDMQTAMDLLARLANDLNLEDHARVQAAQVPAWDESCGNLSWVEGWSATEWLFSQAKDTGLSVSHRVNAAWTLAGCGDERIIRNLLAGHGVDGDEAKSDEDLEPAEKDWKVVGELLANHHSANAHPDLDNAHLDGFFRVQDAMSKVENAEEDEDLWADGADWKVGMDRLAELADNRNLSAFSRVQAAEFLAKANEEAGKARLASLACDTDLDDYFRAKAAWALAGWGVVA
ncbi:NACHT domain-containing protein [Nocardia sp. NPDC058480]|uniref:NACHT domain-containing protein n=1 Tax=Nocardia sp. NPDC058480 TaxID=3346522 RepID=UPI0036690E35